MRKKKHLISPIICIICILLSGCSTYGDEDFYGGRIVGSDELAMLHSMVAAADTDRYPSETDESGRDVFFWTRNGTARHSSRSCQSLSSSSELFSGTEEEAIAAGKEKLCGICG